MIERFLDYIEVEKRYSPHTVTNYKKDLSDFSNFVLKTESSDDVVHVHKKIIKNFNIFNFFFFFFYCATQPFRNKQTKH